MQDEKNEKEKLEVRMQEMEMEMRHEKEKQSRETGELNARNKEMETRLEELEDRLTEEKDVSEKKMGDLEATVRMEVKEIASNFSNSNPSLRDLTIVIISAFKTGPIHSLQTVTFDSFLANFNNANRPGGGDGELNLDSGLFTCFAPGYYSVSFSAHAVINGGDTYPTLYLYLNDTQLPESKWYISHDHAVSTQIGVTGSRIVVSNLFEMFG